MDPEGIPETAVGDPNGAEPDNEYPDGMNDDDMASMVVVLK